MPRSGLEFVLSAGCHACLRGRMRLAEKPDRLGQAGVLMKLATVRVGSTTQAAILDGDRYLLLDQRDIVELMRAGLSPSNLRPQKAIHCDAAVPATLLPRPSKIRSEERRVG